MQLHFTYQHNYSFLLLLYLMLLCTYLYKPIVGHLLRTKEQHIPYLEVWLHCPCLDLSFDVKKITSSSWSFCAKKSLHVWPMFVTSAVSRIAGIVYSIPSLKMPIAKQTAVSTTVRPTKFSLGQYFQIVEGRLSFAFWVYSCRHFWRRDLELKSSNTGFSKSTITGGKVLLWR